MLTHRQKLPSRITYSDQIYTELCNSLSSGELAPGDRLSIRKIAALLGVSMMPVREAITRLVVDGALESLPTKAIRVPVMTQSMFEEILTVRIEIEGFAAEQAAINRTAEQLAVIKHFNSNFINSLSDDRMDNKKALLANRNFHSSIYKASGLATIVRITEMLWLRVGPVINLDLNSRMAWRAAASLACHEQLVQAIENRNAKEARKALREDLIGTAKFIRDSSRL